MMLMTICYLCFAKLEGKVDDSNSNIKDVDQFNNAKIYPRINSLVSKDYFRFYKVRVRWYTFK